MSLPSLVDLMKGAKPFEIKLDFTLRGESSRFGLLLEGPYGWGEFAPFAYHSANHQARWLQAAVEMGWKQLPNPKKSEVPVNAIVPFSDLSRVEKLVKTVGSNTIKVKFAAKDLAADLAILEKISQTVTSPIFRIDFNQALTADLTQEYLDGLADFNVEYLEEPSTDLAVIKKIKQRIPIAIDESIRLQTEAIDLTWVKNLDWADFWILKPIPLGGFSRTQLIAEAATKPVVISGSFDSSCGLYLTTLAATWLSELPAGAATGALLKTDVTANSLIPSKGMVEVKKVVPDLITTPPESVVGKLFRQLETAYFELVQLEG